MKRRFLLIVSLFALPALAPADSAQTPAEKVLPLLQSLEQIPAATLLDTVVSGDASGTLRELAADPSRPAAARLQAYTALGQYPGGANQTFLSSAVEGYAGASVGAQVLFLRAAARSLGRVAGSAAVPQLGTLLDHAVPDVRADGAMALALTGSDTALPVLRAHLLREENSLVHLALVEAIRELTRP